MAVPEALMKEEDSGSFLLDNPDHLLEPKHRAMLQRIFDSPDRDNLLLQLEAQGFVDRSIESYVNKPCHSGIEKAMANPKVHKVVAKLVEASHQTPKETCAKLVPMATQIMLKKAEKKGSVARYVVKKLLKAGLKDKMVTACDKGLTKVKAFASRAVKKVKEKAEGLVAHSDDSDDSDSGDSDSDDLELISTEWGSRRRSSPSPPPGPVSPLTSEVEGKVCSGLVKYVKAAVKKIVSKYNIFGR